MNFKNPLDRLYKVIIKDYESKEPILLFLGDIKNKEQESGRFNPFKNVNETLYVKSYILKDLKEDKILLSKNPKEIQKKIDSSSEKITLVEGFYDLKDFLRMIS
jgi:hypothetical protein